MVAKRAAYLPRGLFFARYALLALTTKPTKHFPPPSPKPFSSAIALASGLAAVFVCSARHSTRRAAVAITHSGITVGVLIESGVEALFHVKGLSATTRGFCAGSLFLATAAAAARQDVLAAAAATAGFRAGTGLVFAVSGSVANKQNYNNSNGRSTDLLRMGARGFY